MGKRKSGLHVAGSGDQPGKMSRRPLGALARRARHPLSQRRLAIAGFVICVSRLTYLSLDVISDKAETYRAPVRLPSQPRSRVLERRQAASWACIAIRTVRTVRLHDKEASSLLPPTAFWELCNGELAIIEFRVTE